jgi:hypothetical protein
MDAQPISEAKSTAGGSRWYSHSYAVNIFNGGTMEYNLLPLWYDSTVLQINDTTADTIPMRYISAAEMIDPIYYTLFNDPNIYPPGTISIDPSDGYFIDSISFGGVYVKNVNRPNTIVDTLILSVSVYNYEYNWHTAATGDPEDAWVNNYVPTAGDTLKAFTIFDVDSVQRASNVPGSIVWKVPLDSAMRLVDTGTLNDVVTYTLPVMVNGVPGQYNIPAGRGVAVTITFKSGDTVMNPGQDMFTDYHHFYLLSGEALGLGQAMPYYYYTMSDRNMSNLMRSNDSTKYYSSVELEGFSTVGYAPEFHSISARATCPTCPVSAEKISKSFSAVKVYPNPAESEIIISFSTLKDNKVNLSIVSTVGQVILQKDLGVVKANDKIATVVSTSNLANGVYFYTVEADGQKSTGRFVVTH